MNLPARNSGPDTPSPVVPAEPAPEFPFPLVAVAGRSAEREWRRYQAEWRKEGASAVLVGNTKDVAQLAEMMSFNESNPEDTLRAASLLTPETYFAQRRGECVEEGAEPDDGPWPDETLPPIELGAHLEVLSRQPKQTVYLARIPTPHAEEIPAYLRFGNWNDCPAPETHVMVLKHWAQTYDIEVYAMTADVLECVVARPPGSKEAAMVLAREQFLYCPDIVTQGVGTVSALGATIQDSGAWYFWWD